MNYLESDISRLGVCSWHRGVKGSIWPPGLAEHHHLILDGDLEEKHVGSHSGRYPKVDGPMETVPRGQNGFNILKRDGKGQGGSLSHPIPSPTHKRG